jgi:hypothetical protein
MRGWRSWAAAEGVERVVLLSEGFVCLPVCVPLLGVCRIPACVSTCVSGCRRESTLLVMCDW